MIIMQSDATEEQIAAVIDEIKKYGLRADVSRGAYRTVIGLIGDEGIVDLEHFTVLPGVKDVMGIETPYKIISREYGKQAGELTEGRLINVGNISIGGETPVYIAGPCAVENRDQLLRIAEGVKQAGGHILRGGIFKPRSSVHSFQGIGAGGREQAEAALRWLQEAGKQFELATITEIRGESQVDLVAEYIDILQIGARNMYDQDLLTSVAGKGKPVLLKRHFGAGIQEFLSFAEYIAAEGNKDIILCERGIVPVGKGKSFTRYTLDLAAVPAIAKETYLPIFVDPSHGTGRRDLILNMSCAAIAAGANGLMIEVHYNPAEAVVDGAQTITPDEFAEVIQTCNQIHQIIAPSQR